MPDLPDIDAAVADILLNLDDWGREIHTRYGKAVSDRMAAEGLHKRDLGEAATAIVHEFPKIRAGMAVQEARRKGMDLDR